MAAVRGAATAFELIRTYRERRRNRCVIFPVMISDPFTMKVPDGVDLYVYRWLPGGVQPRAVVQIAHGASEHAGRYERLARELTGAGYGVYANDHRGHGRTAGSLERFGIASHDNWNRLVDDARLLTERIADAHPGRPIVLLGHSMGSLVAQACLQRGAKGLTAAVLSGTLSSLPSGAEDLGPRVEEAIAREGRDAPSQDFAMLFVGFNDAFVASPPPGGPTGFEWLSRDQVEVQKYVDDPWCGLPLSNGFVADNVRGLDEIWAPGSDERLPRHIPVLFIAGDQDPVGEFGQGVRRLAERYRRVGIRVTERLYPGARHEMFNETNRDQVHRDLLDWLEEVRA
jgi:alpha-beta hydrolase superfamily lysophospholipase